MLKKRAYIGFDYDNDRDLKVLLIGQSRNSDSPFEIVDYSIKVASIDWKDEARARMRRSDVAIFICGKKTHTATGVSIEVQIARELKLPYFFLWGRAEGNCYLPSNAYPAEKIYSWTWPNLKALLNGER